MTELYVVTVTQDRETYIKTFSTNKKATDFLNSEFNKAIDDTGLSYAELEDMGMADNTRTDYAWISSDDFNFDIELFTVTDKDIDTD